MGEISAVASSAGFAIPTAHASVPLGHGSDFAAILDQITLEMPRISSFHPSILKDVAVAQQQLMSTAMAPLPDISHMSQSQALGVMTRKFSDVTMAHMSFTVASAGASGAKKSVETVLNHK